MSAELPPEAQAVIDAALAWDSDEYMDRGSQLEANLEAALANYRKATTPPEPFMAYLSGATCSTFGDPPMGMQLGMQAVIYDLPPEHANDIWRCTVTPIERVR